MWPESCHVALGPHLIGACGSARAVNEDMRSNVSWGNVRQMDESKGKTVSPAAVAPVVGPSVSACFSRHVPRDEADYTRENRDRARGAPPHRLCDTEAVKHDPGEANGPSRAHR